MRRLGFPLRGSAVLALSCGLVLGACGSSSSSGSATTSSSATAPEDVLVPDATVTAGLATLGHLVKTASSQAKTSGSAAKATADQAEEQWQKIEGRIKKNDTGAYLDFEDALSDVRTGASENDAAKVAKGATAVAAASAAYLAKFTG